MGQSRMRVDSPEVTGTRFAIEMNPVSAVSSCEALVETYESGGPVLGPTTSITSVSTRRTRGWWEREWNEWTVQEMRLMTQLGGKFGLMRGDWIG